MADSDMASTAVRGGKALGASLLGSAVLGPTLGPVAGGFAASSVLDGRKAPYKEVGIGLGLASVLLGASLMGGNSGGSGSGGSHTRAHARGFK